MRSCSVRWVTQMKQISFKKAGRELGAKAFHEYEGSGSGSGNDRKKGRQPQVFTGTSAIFSLTTAPRVDWVKGNHRRYGYHDRLGQNQKDL